MQDAATFLELAGTHAQERGAAVSLRARGRPPLRYDALHAQILHVGTSLAALGVGRGNRVALALPDGSELAAAILATMCWATCAPLRRDFAADAAMDLLARLRIGALIVPAEPDIGLVTAARRLQLQVIRLIPEREGMAGLFSLEAETLRPAVEAEPLAADDVALLSLTSGTTGKPKIVPHSQRNILDVARSALCEPGDRTLCLAALSSAGVRMTSLFLPVTAGASIACVTGFTAADLPALLDEFEPTTFWTNPATLATAVAVLGGRRPATLQYVRSSSAPLPATLQERVEQALGVPIVQGYGMTETYLIATNRTPPGRRCAGSVGLAHTAQIAIRGDDGQPLPAGSVGEITVAGPGVTAGYEGDPQANHFAFDGEWFRTGDMGYLDDDGYLFLTARRSELINRGGMKVSPLEVDEVLMRHPNVRLAVTFPVAHASLGEDVAAAVVLHDAGSTSSRVLREFGAAHLPPYMVPSTVVVVNDLPVSATGKIRRDQLAALLADSLQPPYVAPRDPHEVLIASVIAEVLGIAQVGSDDNFFAIGGDSLRGGQVLSRIAVLTGVQLEVVSLFRAPTVGELARVLVAAGRAEARPEERATLRRRQRPQLDSTPQHGSEETAP